jgi:peptidoglycan/xylan/chitin deacetylase (PgdA/CDA1 family)
VNHLGPLILAYHAVSSTWRAQLAVSEVELRSHVAFLKRRGYTGLTFSEAERRRSDGTLPERSLVVTFDDGYASTLRALPILADAGFPATVFVVTQFTESGEPLAWPGIERWLEPATRDELTPLTWSDVERLVEAGWEIGSHTVCHQLLTALREEPLRDELLASKTAIAERVGSCSVLSYPYGIADATVASFAEDVGYHSACTLTFVHLSDEPMRRPRVGISRSDTGMRFVAQVSPLARRLRATRVARLARSLHRRRDWLPEPHPLVPL